MCWPSISVSVKRDWILRLSESGPLFLPYIYIYVYIHTYTRTHTHTHTIYIYVRRKIERYK